MTRNAVLATLAAVVLLVASATIGVAQRTQSPTDGPVGTPGGQDDGTTDGGPGPATGQQNETAPAPPLSPDRFEPNDDFANATAVGEGNLSNLSITEGDVGVYALDVTAGRPVSVSVEFSHEDSDLDAVLVDRDEVLPVAVSEGVTDDELLSYLPPENRTLYAAVIGFQNATGTYNLTVEGAIGPEAPANATTTPDNGTVGQAG